jgi:tetratricopeptide (TPR) repeat protein
LKSADRNRDAEHNDPDPSSARVGPPRKGGWGRRLALAAALLVLVSANAAAFVLVRGDSEPADLMRDGLHAEMQGQVDEARTVFDKLVATEPTNKFAWYNLGLLDQSAQRPSEAEREYRRSLLVDPDYVPALFNLAVLLTPTQPIEAVNLYKHAIEVRPDYAPAHLNLGLLLLSGPDKAMARPALARAVELDPALAARVPPG